MHYLRHKVDDLECRSRRSNLIYNDQPDSPSETWAESTKIVHAVNRDLYSIHEEFPIERAHRVGQFHPQKRRPIVAKYLNYSDKERVLSKARKVHPTNLDGIGHIIQQDYSVMTKEATLHLADYVIDAREQGAEADLKFNRARNDGHFYMWDDRQRRVRRDAHRTGAIGPTGPI